jgi:hypothetical protein
MKKEKTLEELVAMYQEITDTKKKNNLDNIAKLTERFNQAQGDEKTRLDGLIKLQEAYKIELNKTDVNALALAQEAFQKQNQQKDKLPSV